MMPDILVALGYHQRVVIQTHRAHAMNIRAGQFLLLTGAAFAAGAALAAEPDDRVGWAISAAVGPSLIRDEDGPDTFEGNGFGLAAEVELRFTPNLALGVGGFSLGRADDDFGGVDTEISVRGFDLFGRVIFPVSDTAEIFGRIGAANYRVDIDPGSVSFSDALFGDDALELGLGVDFARKDKLAFRIEGRYFNGGDDETGALLLFGVNYIF